MTDCDIHRWERYELRDYCAQPHSAYPHQPWCGPVYYVGYRCSNCGEPGYALDMEASSRLGPARGILTGLFLGIAMWAVILSLLGLFR